MSEEQPMECVSLKTVKCQAIGELISFLDKGGKREDFARMIRNDYAKAIIKPRLDKRRAEIAELVKAEIRALATHRPEGIEIPVGLFSAIDTPELVSAGPVARSRTR
jgi:hypothetical protein